MKLKQQVCSLELAQKLKELGIKQKSLFCYWIKNNNKLSNIRENEDIKIIQSYYDTDFKISLDEDDFISAFTVSELGEMLPKGYVSIKNDKNIKKLAKAMISKLQNKKYITTLADYFDDGIVGLHDIIELSEADTEADTRAKSLIILIKEKIFSIDEINENYR